MFYHTLTCPRCHSVNWGNKDKLAETWNYTEKDGIVTWHTICRKCEILQSKSKLFESNVFLLADSKWQGLSWPEEKDLSQGQYTETLKQKVKGGEVYLTDGSRVWKWKECGWIRLPTFNAAHPSWRWLECEENERDGRRQVLI